MSSIDNVNREFSKRFDLYADDIRKELELADIMTLNVNVLSQMLSDIISMTSGNEYRRYYKYISDDSISLMENKVKDMVADVREELELTLKVSHGDLALLKGSAKTLKNFSTNSRVIDMFYQMVKKHAGCKIK